MPTVSVLISLREMFLTRSVRSTLGANLRLPGLVWKRALGTPARCVPVQPTAGVVSPVRAESRRMP